MNGDYQAQATTTAIYRKKIEDIVDYYFGTMPEDKAKAKIVDLLAFAYVTLGLVGEAGEIANKAKKVIRDGAGKITDEFKADMDGEIGDVEWYQANLSEELGLDLDIIRHRNLEKLFGRKERGTLSGSGDKR